VKAPTFNEAWELLWSEAGGSSPAVPPPTDNPFETDAGEVLTRAEYESREAAEDAAAEAEIDPPPVGQRLTREELQDLAEEGEFAAGWDPNP
jgi:hypothetical protein